MLVKIINKMALIYLHLRKIEIQIGRNSHKHQILYKIKKKELHQTREINGNNASVLKRKTANLIKNNKCIWNLKLMLLKLFKQDKIC